MPSNGSRRSRRGPINEINMVPFIDIMLVLLIIFMITAPLMTPGMINVPSAGESSKPPDLRVDVLINEDGEYALDGEIRREGLAEGDVIAALEPLLEQNPDLPVMIAADSELRYREVMAMMKQLREAGVRRVGLAVK